MNRNALLSLLAIAAASAACGRDASPDAEPQPVPSPAGAEAAAAPAGRGLRMEGDSIVTDTFDIRHTLEDGNLVLSLDSDLSDATKLMVRISRDFMQEGFDTPRSPAYLDQASTVGEWRGPRTVDVRAETWQALLDEHRRAVETPERPFTVTSVSDSIRVHFMVPVNQDPPFELWNANLGGSVVTQGGDLRIVERTAAVHAPLSEQPGSR